MKEDQITESLDAGAVPSAPELAPQVSLSPSPYGEGTRGRHQNGAGEQDAKRRPSAVRFSDLPAPAERLYVVEELVPEGYVSMLYGDGGSAKSLLGLDVAMAFAGGAKEWLGRKVQHGPVLYLDFELDADEQHRRAHQLARGMGLEQLPGDLYYMSALGFSSDVALEAALSECKKHEIEFLILDSVGLALKGDAESSRDVIEFHRDLDRLRAEGATILVVDHQSRTQHGQRYRDKRAFGSVYKGNLTRSVLQAEATKHEEEKLTVELRHVKHNFGPLASPFGAEFTFAGESIRVEPVTLDPDEPARGRTLNAEDKVVRALEAGGPAYPGDLVEKTGLALKTVQNVLTELRKTGKVEYTGNKRGQAKEVSLMSQPLGGEGQERRMETQPEELPQKENAEIGSSGFPATPSEMDTSPSPQVDQKDDVDPNLVQGLRRVFIDNPNARERFSPHILAYFVHDWGHLDRQPREEEVVAALEALEEERRGAKV